MLKFRKDCTVINSVYHKSQYPNMSWGVFILCNRIKGDNISLWVALANEKKHPFRNDILLHLALKFSVLLSQEEYYEDNLYLLPTN